MLVNTQWTAQKIFKNKVWVIVGNYRLSCYWIWIILTEVEIPIHGQKNVVLSWSLCYREIFDKVFWRLVLEFMLLLEEGMVSYKLLVMDSGHILCL